MTSDDKTARDLLIEKARELFTERGYADVSTRDLAEAAGVNLGAIQYHFGSKAKLFIETVHACFDGQACNPKSSVLVEEPKNREDAAVKLTHFIFGMLHSILCSDSPHPARLMFREILSPTSKDPEMFEALISSVVNDFIGPSDQSLLKILRLINTKLSTQELELSVHSVIGQCFFYMTHGPFIERLRDKQYSKGSDFEEAAAHVVRTTLRSLLCDEAFIKTTLVQATKSCPKPIKKKG